MTWPGGAAAFGLTNQAETAMADHVYKMLDLVGSSEKSIEAAIEVALARAHETTRHLRWFEVTQVRGHIEDGRVSHYQVAMRVGFTVEET